MTDLKASMGFQEIASNAFFNLFFLLIWKSEMNGDIFLTRN